MKSICLFFQIHQPFRYRRYRFFDIGNDHYYYDDYSNETNLRKVAAASYMPMNELLLRMIEKYGKNFKVSFSVTGAALNQFELYAPELITSFQKLAQSGCVEFLSETFSHSLSSLHNSDVFEQQVKLHHQKIKDLFGHDPKVFRNTEMIYSDQIGAQVFQMGYKAMLTEGAKHVLGWKSPNFLYVNAVNPRMKVLMRNFKLSDDIAFRFSNTNWSEFPLTAEKYIGWLEKLQEREEVINLFLSYESFGQRLPKESGIFDFIEHWVDRVVRNDTFKFVTPSQVIEELQPVSIVSVPNAISWADEERDLSSWLGNEMQKEAFDKLYVLSHKMTNIKDEELIKDWNYLQESDHFYYMSTKFFTGSHDQAYNNPYDSPYEAFINYMNVLSDFSLRLDLALTNPEKDTSDVEYLKDIIREKEKIIRTLELEIQRKQKPRTQTGNKSRRQKPK